MPKYEFIKYRELENKFDYTAVKFEVETCDRQEMIEAFEEFLRACGYQVGSLVEEENDG